MDKIGKTVTGGILAELFMFGRPLSTKTQLQAEKSDVAIRIVMVSIKEILLNSLHENQNFQFETWTFRKKKKKSPGAVGRIFKKSQTFRSLPLPKIERENKHSSNMVTTHLQLCT